MAAPDGTAHPEVSATTSRALAEKAGAAAPAATRARCRSRGYEPCRAFRRRRVRALRAISTAAAEARAARAAVAARAATRDLSAPELALQASPARRVRWARA